MNEYRTYRKKMDSRRLTLDASLTRQRTSKRDNPAIEQEVELAQERLDEAADETKLRMQAIKEEQEVQFHALAALLDAELEYFSRCKSVLEDLLSEFPTSYEAPAGSSSSRPVTRPRAKSSASASARSATPKKKDSDEDETPKKERPEMNRARSDSASRKRISIMSSLGNIGNKGMKGGKAAASVASSAASKTASYRPSQRLFGRSEKKYANMDEEERRAVSLATDDEDSRYDPPARGGSPPKNRQRSHSVAAEIITTTNGAGRRRALTTPSTPGTFVKVLFDFEGLEADELPLRRGQIVEVRSEVSADWLIGEADGMTGLFPKAFTEEYIPDRPALPSRPGSFSHLRNHTRLDVPEPSSRSTHSDISGGESDDDSLNIIDDGQSTSLASAPAPTPTSRSRAGSVARKAPPPPPSRRASAMSPPRPPVPRSRSSTLSRPQEASPFGASPFSDQ